MIEEKKIFTRKPFNSYLYKWSPETNLSKTELIQPKGKVEACSAKPFSQGEDWKTTYVYNETYDSGKLKRLAYVECDYVE